MSDSDLPTDQAVILIASFWLVYFLPTVFAMARRHRSVLAIALLNTVLGWTLVGWIASMVWTLFFGRRPVTAAPAGGQHDA